jgi:hypothetical protein
MNRFVNGKGLGNMNSVMSNSQVNADQAVDNTKMPTKVPTMKIPAMPVKKPKAVIQPKPVQPARLAKPAMPMAIKNGKSKKK